MLERNAGNPARQQWLRDHVFGPTRGKKPDAGPIPPPPGFVAMAGAGARPPETRVVRRAEAKRARAAASPAPQLSARELAAAAKRERQIKGHRASERHLQRVFRTLRADGVPIDVQRDCAIIPRSVWVRVSALLADGSSRAVRIHLKQLRNKVLAGAIRHAALCGGKYPWSHPRARAVAALGIALLALAKRTRRRGRWEFLIKGIPQGALLALLRNPWTGDRPSRGALSGTHRTGVDWESGQVGWLRALEGAGALYCQQIPAAEAEPCELLGPSGYATNRIWLVTDTPTAPLDDDDKRELLELHAAGLSFAGEVPRMQPLEAHALAELAAAIGPPPPA